MLVLTVGSEARTRKYLPDLPIAREVDLVCAERGASNDDLLAAAPDADAIVADAISPVDMRLIEAMPNLKLIHSEGVAFNAIDVEAARARGIAVCNVPGYSTEAVAQHTFALMLALVDRITEAASTPIGESALSRLPLPRFCLGGKTLGIIGLGAIGRRVAQLASAFGMRVYAAEHLGTVGGAVEALTPPVGMAEPGGGISRLPLPQLLAESDIVSLHCPLTERSRHIINADAVERMKDGAMLINTARGALVDETALAAALRSGKLAGAAADVTEIEPTPADCPLRTAPNCILTPHVAWACGDARRALMTEVRENIEAFLRGERRNRID